VHHRSALTGRRRSSHRDVGERVLISIPALPQFTGHIPSRVFSPDSDFSFRNHFEVTSGSTRPQNAPVGFTGRWHGVEAPAERGFDRAEIPDQSNGLAWTSQTPSTDANNGYANTSFAENSCAGIPEGFAPAGGHRSCQLEHLPPLQPVSATGVITPAFGQPPFAHRERGEVPALVK
jgi:hypothetical protein